MKKVMVLLFALGFFWLIDSCKKIMPPTPKVEDVMDAPVEGLSAEQNKLFLEGAEEFDEVYTAENGLGPIFVATSCGGCHTGDNKGHPFTALTRFGQNDTTGNKFLAFGAPQIQHRALMGHVGESVPVGATSSKFIAPIASGVGFLELVSDQDILSMADPNDSDGDGISGVPNWNNIPSWVTPAPNASTQNGKYICRFGRKASTYNFNNDIGVTSTFMPQNPFNYAEGMNSSPINDPEITDKSINATVFYLQTLQTPLPRNENNAQVQRGKELFIQVGCESCHKQTLKTGYSAIEPLSNQTFHPYTDLLLHDMGNELNDHYTEGSALVSEWRTTPLWGVGLSASSQGGQLFLMHDSRAKNFAEAILLHGGEGNKSRSQFNQLSEPDKQALLTFLKSL
jgi:CxxC motif-containing protein (DUF1111 family)